MPKAFYFGCGDRSGHYLFDERRSSMLNPSAHGIPWGLGSMDSGLLVNGKEPDRETGRVRWTCAKGDWLAFFWWDNSVDSRGGSNSGFYVQGFGPTLLEDAFKFASDAFPWVIKRQRKPLTIVFGAR